MRHFTAFTATLSILVPGIANAGEPAGPPVPAPAASQAPATPSAAPEQPIPASAFAAHSAFGSARLSPDGKLIAIRVASGDTITIALYDSETQELVRRIVVGDTQQLEWYRWAGNDRLLISLSRSVTYFGEEARLSRLISYDLPTASLTKIGWNASGLAGDRVIFTDPDGRYVLLALQKSIYEWPSVVRYDLAPSGKPDRGVKVQSAQTGIWNWFTDDAGNVRMGFEAISGERLKIWYRSAAGQPLKMIAKLGNDDYEDKIWDIVRITSGSDEGYILEKVDGKVALRKFNYATRTSGEIVYRNPDWDLTEATIGDDGNPKAAFFTDDKDRIVWFDEDMKKTQSRLERAMKDMDVRITSRARDDSRMLVYVGREDDPGALYIFTPAAKTLKFFAAFRPELNGRTLARPRAISYTARDGTTVHGYLTLPAGKPERNLPLIIHPHGGPYGVRDTLSYDDEVQFLANRGYAVLQPNYRGSEGYGEAFEDLGKGQIGRTMQDDLDDAMDWAVKQGFADPARVCVVGASYGGYAALWAVIRNPDRYRCAASFAGVTDLERQFRYDRQFFTKKGRREWRTWTHGEDGSFEFASVSPALQVSRLTRPVLLAHGDADSNVPFSQYREMRDAAAKASVPLDLLVFKDEGHGFDKPEDEQRWYETLGAFLHRNNPAD